jgi:hypothetical protein
LARPSSNQGDALSSGDATLAGGLATFAFDDVGSRVAHRRRGERHVRTRARSAVRVLARRAGHGPGNTGGAWQQQRGRAAVPTSRPSGASVPRTLITLRFSQLSPHATTGAFSGEIRFGWRIDVDAAGKVTRTPIRGGSVSGVVFDAFARARFSREVAVRGRTHGPRAVRFDALQITGG